ncbi:GDSL-type esterase/lipase family protein [Curtobacterium sp. PhB115]|uniref:GDSL-type esterase/lipase family protein n=1 Tax=Curtobacterium sp. PhB115 TaxID=2485173 RepID=UPI000F4B4CCE|nr:GDSL-type esterase/lipase family protein [Curtobacterium sp. PhB115]ROP74612.1 lysophospholipase L1-like esterase [Curtobacterium sp. PhB115]
MSTTATWQATWVQAISDYVVAQRTLEDVTVRIDAPASSGGEALRIELSNRFGTDSVTIDHSGVATRAGSGDARWDGERSVTLAPGQTRWSDPVDVATDAGETVHVDLHMAGPTLVTSANGFAWTVSSPGDHVGAADFPDATPASILDEEQQRGLQGMTLPASGPFLSAVDVAGSPTSRVVVCLGDSITAMGWPQLAAARLSSDRATTTGIVNRGIAGNRLRHGAPFPMTVFGRAGLARFDDDVLGTSGVTDVVLALGTNDLGHPGSTAPLDELPTAEDLVAGYREVVRRATKAGLRTMIATITPFLPGEAYDAAREAVRQEVNAWIRSSAPTYVDYDAALRSDTEPSRMQAVYDVGDHLHPSQQGQERLAEALVTALSDR